MPDKNEYVKYWLQSAEHDLSVAETLFLNEKYDWSLFIGHLVLEKVLKALWVKDNEPNIPPRTHNLLILAKETKLKLNDEQKLFLADVNTYNLEVRYPESKTAFYKLCTKSFTEERFNKIKEMKEWLTSQISSGN